MTKDPQIQFSGSPFVGVWFAVCLPWPGFAIARGNGRKVRNHSDSVAFSLLITVFGFHVGHHVGQMVKMLADMMADMKILKMPIHHGFFCSIESCWPT